MFYICFDPSASIPFLSAGRFVSHHPHPHPKRRLESAVLLLGYSGKCAIAQDDREYTLERGTFMLLFPDTLHYGTRPTTNDQSHFWCHFLLPEGFVIREADSAEELNRDGLLVLPEFSRIRSSEKLFVLFSQMIDEAEARRREAAVICEHYIKILLLSLADQCRESTMQPAAGSSVTEKVKEWVRLHACEGIRVCDAASAFTYNPDYLSRLIKADTGMTLCAYINAVRLEMAKNLLLNSNLYVSQIAYHVGFADEKYFMKLFLKAENVTPSQYRKSCRKIHINNK